MRAPDDNSGAQAELRKRQGLTPRRGAGARQGTTRHDETRPRTRLCSATHAALRQRLMTRRRRRAFPEGPTPLVTDPTEVPDLMGVPQDGFPTNAEAPSGGTLLNVLAPLAICASRRSCGDAAALPPWADTGLARADTSRREEASLTTGGHDRTQNGGRAPRNGRPPGPQEGGLLR